MGFSHTWPRPTSRLSPLAFLTLPLQLLCHGSPSGLGCVCVLRTEGGSQHRPVLHLRPEHLSVLHSLPQESGVGDAQRKGPQGHWPFLVGLLDAQSLNEYLCSCDSRWSTGHRK